MSGADVLSQSEIDQLLSALSTGVVSAEEMKAHRKKVTDMTPLARFGKPKEVSGAVLFLASATFPTVFRLLNTESCGHTKAV